MINPPKYIHPIPALEKESTVMLNGMERNFPKPFTGKKFLFRVLFLFIVVLLVSVSVHVVVDMYGLFRDNEGRHLKVYHNERISKYLLSHRYIPGEFKTVIIGTSLSDNLDVTPLNQQDSSISIYNASMMGANISEVSTVARKLVEGGIRNVVFCVSPYQMKNSGAKEVELNEKLFWGALGSKNLYETYAVRFIREAGLAPRQYPTVHINEYGVNFFTERYRVSDVRKRILDVRDKLKGQPFQLDSTALADFKSLIHYFSQQKVKLTIYFHPVPQELFESQVNEYDKFQSLVRSIIPSETSILDFNDESYQFFRKDYTNYIDNGHLSEKGQSFILKTLYQSLSRPRPSDDNVNTPVK